jgi:sulfonate transport system permease protein
MNKRRLALRLAAVLFAVAVVALWQFVAWSGVFSRAYFTSPAETFEALLALQARGELWRPLAGTCLRMVYGWALASVLGIVIGAGLAQSGRLREFVEPTLEFLRPLPASAIIPAAILLLGLTPQMAVAVIAFGSIWPVLLGSYNGFSRVDERIIEVAQLQEMPVAEFLWKIALPCAFPDIFAGLRVNLAIALILAVVVEIQAGLTGLGFNIMIAQRLFRTPELYAGIVVLGLIGFITSRTLLLVERWLLRWRSLGH